MWSHTPVTVDISTVANRGFSQQQPKKKKKKKKKKWMHNNVNPDEKALNEPSPGYTVHGLQMCLQVLDEWRK